VIGVKLVIAEVDRKIAAEAMLSDDLTEEV